MPFHVAEAKELHRSLVPYLEWQTTFSYLKDPPVEYRMPAYDFWAAFDKIGKKVSSAAYPRELDFGMDLFLTFNNVQDTHFGYVLDIVGKAFTFERSISLVSVSKDSGAVPQVYVHGTAPNFETRPFADVRRR